MAAGDLTTLANVKGWLRLQSDADDVLLARLVTAYSAYVQSWLNRRIAITAYVETRDGLGRPGMMVANAPLVSIASVVVDGFSIPPSPAVGQPGFYFDERTIYLLGYGFSRGRANVRLAYMAGYASTPPEIEQAVIELVGLRYREIDRIGFSSKSLAGETVSFIVKDFPDSVQTILNNYRKVVPL
ncbi:MAG: phage head-tail connector protein [Betaproteobacteria bacterium]|nr:phage head-tail connector protein [Betaproteobacteria bacterium]